MNVWVRVSRQMTQSTSSRRSEYRLQAEDFTAAKSDVPTPAFKGVLYFRY